jgi:hypothetical protein
MKSTIKLALLFTLAVGLVGCASRPAQVQYVSIPTHTPVTPELIEPCVMLSKPLNKDDYLSMSPSEKELTLVKYNIAVQTDWEICAKKIKAISLEDNTRQENSKKARDEIQNR